MAIYQTRNCICAVQWDPEDKQSLENIKALVKDNPRLGWKVRDNIIHNCVTIYSFTHDVMRIMPYEYLVEGKKNSLFIVPAESFELMYESDESRKW